jgi:hypothetical protein
MESDYCPCGSHTQGGCSCPYSLQKRLDAIVQATRWDGDGQKHDEEWLRTALIRCRNLATGRVSP